MYIMNHQSLKLLSFGLPQGFVLGPKLFSPYINSIGSILKKYGLNQHIYADDIQIYFTANSAAATEIAISRCLKSVSENMNENKLYYYYYYWYIYPPITRK